MSQPKMQDDTKTFGIIESKYVVNAKLSNGNIFFMENLKSGIKLSK